MRIYAFVLVMALFLGLMVGAHMTADVVSADPIPGQRIQVPVIWTTEGWETEIKVQNVGITTTRAVLLLWGPYSETCEPNNPGPIIAQCSINIAPGAAQTWKLRDVWDDPMSGIIYSVDPERADEACEAARDALGDTFDWLEWEQEWDEGTGEDLTFGDPDGARGSPIAVTVTRLQLGGGGEPPRTSTYVGLSEAMEDVPDDTGTFTYFAPLNFDTYNPSRWQTTIHIQNSGDACAIVDITFQTQEDCLDQHWGSIDVLAPGETVAIPSTLGGNEVGSAWLRSSQPLGIIVDEENEDGDVLLTYHGLPKALGSTINHAPVIYKDFEGWNSGVQVQNLSRTYNAKVKVYFLDKSGGIITSIVDWICPQGSRTYFLPVIANLPEHYFGAVRVESQAWVRPGGVPVEPPPVFSVVNLVNYLTRQGLSYNTFPEQEVLGVGTVALPSLVKGVTPFVDGITWSSEILIQNLNPSYLGDATVRIDFYDANGWVESVCQTIPPNAVDLVNLAEIGILPAGWRGSGVVTWQCGGFSGMDVLVVERASGETFSDLSKGYQGIPLPDGPTPPVDIQCPGCGDPGMCTWTLYGQVIDALDLKPIEGATVTVVSGTWEGQAVTDSTGNYALEVPASQGSTFVTVVAAGHADGEAEVPPVECFRFHQLNFGLTPDEQSIFVSGMVEDKMSGEPIEGATVEATNCVDVAEDVTDLDGAYAIELSFAPNCTTWVCASAEGYNMACDSVWVPKGDTALIDFQLRRTPNSRLLLYYGNGGWDDGTNYTHLAEFFEEEFGLIVDYTDQWPGEFGWTSTYKLIVLLAPGHDSGDDLLADGFTWQQKAELDSYLQQGGFLVVLSDATSFTGQAVENDLLADLPVDLQFGVNGGDFTDGFGNQITDHCLTTNVFTYSAIDVNDDWTDVDDPNGMADPGALILQNASGPGAGLPMYMADVPSHGNGLVIILGDVHGLSDATYGPADFNWPGDNEWMARNWIDCDP